MPLGIAGGRWAWQLFASQPRHRGRHAAVPALDDPGDRGRGHPRGPARRSRLRSAAGSRHPPFRISGGRHTAARRQPLWRAPGPGPTVGACSPSPASSRTNCVPVGAAGPAWRSSTAVAGGAVLAAAAGALRTDSAYPRFLAQSRASDLLVAPAESGIAGYDAALGTLPGVAASAALVGINAYPVSAAGVPDNNATMFASLDGRYGRTVDVPKLLAGRLPAPDAPREVAVDQIAAQQLHLHVGSVLRMAAIDTKNHVRVRSPPTSSACS